MLHIHHYPWPTGQMLSYTFNKTNTQNTINSRKHDGRNTIKSCQLPAADISHTNVNQRHKIIFYHKHAFP